MNWDWFSQNQLLIQWISIGSIISFFGSLIIIPRLIINLPPDFFLKRKKSVSVKQIVVFRVTFFLLKNFLGFLLLLRGILMLFIPGQGLLTMFLGLVLLDFPGKYKLQLYCLKVRPVRRSLNWVRRKYGKEAFIFPE